MAESKNFKEIGLNSDSNQNNSSPPSSDFDRLEDCNEAAFRGAQLSLSQETSPAESIALGGDDPNGNFNVDASKESLDRRSSSIRVVRASCVQDFFAVREGALQKAAEQCRPVIIEQMDGDLRGVWLLTEIDHWDAEKERLIFLTENSLISLKYDFITLKLLDYKRYPLNQFNQVVIGELKYPDKSLMPKINGAMDFVKQRIIPKIRQGRNFRQPVNANSTNLSVVANQPRTRNQLGVQCSWGNTNELPVLKRWNPWSRDIPFVTYTSHPLYKMDTAEKTNYDIEDFSKKLASVLEASGNVAFPADSPSSAKCPILYQPIVIESYAGIAVALHNANELGFFKSRGKVSF